MSVVKTGNTTHDNKVNTAEAVRQAAVPSTASKTTIVTAEATFNRTAVTSALANNCGVAQFMTALAEAGQSLYP